MFTPPEDFNAETVDEQIEQYTCNQQPTPEVRVVQDLKALYERGDTPDQVRRSLDHIWTRLADQVSPAYQALYANSEVDSLHARPISQPIAEPLNQHQSTIDKQIGKQEHTGGQMIPFPARSAMDRPRKQSLRRTLALSAVAAAMLLSIFSWAVVTHLMIRPSTVTGSGPSTKTPLPTTPASQSLLLQVQSSLAQFHQEVTNWGQVHQFNDTYDGKSYSLDYEYGQQGIGGILDHMVQQANSTEDLQNILALLQNERTNLQAMQTDALDQTPWNQVHTADTGLVQHYQLNTGVVIIISLYEQSMRVYQNGQLIKAIQITTGGFEAPTLPGSWSVFARQSSLIVKSAYPSDSPHWFPPKRVNYALSFHNDGGLIYDSWWRSNYGVGTNFPHKDTTGNPANDGNTASINVAGNEMAWLYSIAQVNTPVVIY